MVQWLDKNINSFGPVVPDWVCTMSAIYSERTEEDEGSKKRKGGPSEDDLEQSANQNPSRKAPKHMRNIQVSVEAVSEDGAMTNVPSTSGSSHQMTTVTQPSNVLSAPGTMTFSYGDDATAGASYTSGLITTQSHASVDPGSVGTFPPGQQIVPHNPNPWMYGEVLSQPSMHQQSTDLWLLQQPLGTFMGPSMSNFALQQSVPHTFSSLMYGEAPSQPPTYQQSTELSLLQHQLSMHQQSTDLSLIEQTIGDFMGRVAAEAVDFVRRETASLLPQPQSSSALTSEASYKAEKKIAKTEADMVGEAVVRLTVQYCRHYNSALTGGTAAPIAERIAHQSMFEPLVIACFREQWMLDPSINSPDIDFARRVEDRLTGNLEGRGPSRDECELMGIPFRP